MTAPASPPLDVARLRTDFPILDQRLYADAERGEAGRPLVYLDSAASTQRPRQVIDAMVDCFERTYANVHRGAHYLSNVSTEAVNEAREKVRRFLNAPRFEEVIFTRGTTESINLVARSWGDRFCRAGDEIVLTELEHHANLVPWQQLAERTGVKLRHISLADDGLLDLSTLPNLLNERTRMVAFAAVSNVLGTINPVREIVAAAKRVGAATLVDAAQSVPHMATDVQAWDADFVAFSGHKMLGPTGIGVLWGRYELLDAMPPFLGGGGMIDQVWLDRFTPGEVPHRFEAGTPAIAEIIGLGAAIDYLQAAGLNAVHAHESTLTLRAHQRLGSIEGLRIRGPSPEHKAGVVSFTIDGLNANDVAAVLDQRGVAVRAGHHCAMPLHARLGVPATTRASFYLYNTVDEVERLGDAVDHAVRMLRRRKRT